MGANRRKEINGLIAGKPAPNMDSNGNLVGMTIEHAKAQANLPEVLFSPVG